MQTVGYLLAKALLREGFEVFAWQDFQSRIRGGESSFRLVFSDDGARGLPGAYDIIVSLDKKNSIVYGRLLAESGIFLAAPGAEDEGAVVPDLGAFGSDASNKKFLNTAMAASAAALTGISADILENLISEEFASKGSEIVNANIDAARAGFVAAKKIPATKFSPKKSGGDGAKRFLMTGNEALALGAIYGGCRFMAAYPMTPSTGIITYLASTSKRTGIIAIQAEDEIAAVNMAVGASYAGARAMTATSGGGFALMTEGISLAAMTELPIVVVLAQRPGPATGLPTRTEQGELLFALHCSHGEFPRFIFAPADASSAISLIREAFDLSWKYRVPSIVLSDQYLADSYWTVPAGSIGKTLPEKSGTLTNDGRDDFKTYALTPNGISPCAAPGTKGKLVICDSDEHDEQGHLTEDLPTRAAMAEKRWRKFPLMEKEFAPPGIEGDKSAGTILVGWGTSATIAEETSKILSAKGLKSAFVKYERIWPLAVNPVLLDEHRQIVVIENNFTGQFARLLAEKGVRVKMKINRFDGLPFFPEELAQKISAGNFNPRRTDAN